MVENFKAGIDPHSATARIILDAIGWDYTDPLSDLHRQYGKVGNFSIIYAGGKPTIMRQLSRAGVECDDALAIQIRDAIKADMPEVELLQKEIKERVDDRGYIETLWGRLNCTLIPPNPIGTLCARCLTPLFRGVRQT